MAKKKQIKSEAAKIVTPPPQEKAIALPLTAAEKEIIAKYAEKLKSNNITVGIKETKQENGDLILKIDGPRGTDDEQLHLFGAAMCSATGANNSAFAGSIYSSCLYAILGSIKTEKQLADKSMEILSALNSFKPADEVEGMLISRMIALHFQGMDFLRRSIIDDQTTVGVDLNINRSTKLMRVYNETLEVLMRYRRKGKQEMIVQHVHVNDGGKAVVTGQMRTEIEG
jgi:hypothetical protein